MYTVQLMRQAILGLPIAQSKLLRSASALGLHLLGAHNLATNQSPNLAHHHQTNRYPSPKFPLNSAHNPTPGRGPMVALDATPLMPSKDSLATSLLHGAHQTALNQLFDQILPKETESQRRFLAAQAVTKAIETGATVANTQGFIRLPITDSNGAILFYCHIPQDPALQILIEVGSLTQPRAKDSGGTKHNAGECHGFLTLKLNKSGPMPASEIIRPNAWHQDYPHIKLATAVNDTTLIVSSAGPTVSALLSKGVILKPASFQPLLEEIGQMATQHNAYLFDYKPQNMGLKQGVVSTFDNGAPQQPSTELKLGRELPFTPGYFPGSLADALERGEPAAWQTASDYGLLVNLIECCLPELDQEAFEEYSKGQNQASANLRGNPLFNPHTAPVLQRFLQCVIKPEHLARALDLLADPVKYGQTLHEPFAQLHEMINFDADPATVFPLVESN